jgi:uncharacterized damage-inducible protein DinB
MKISPSAKRNPERDLLRHLERLFAADEWANREVLNNLKALTGPAVPPPRALKFLNHVVGASLLWLSRLEKEPAALPVWPELSLGECEEHLRSLPRKWRDWFADLAPSDLAESIEYVNSRGQRFTSRIDDVLTQVILHSSYHRGQIAAEVRASGSEPVLTDFIHCARSGLLEGE